ncbi:adenylate/guanylate cyclase domain-containing protein [Pseudodonghicola flavimaris]|uniref:Adenylate/guanylate cyclase domain-containing protein n=1 Tax=Pseudodonghicola flavimaris TaxID=3050036 RepID=A0ABT7F1E7_9RHOB|nr:adenylate/guanylate cyclase domain-containing protein [Pseudodonghicola flavimaris]MDK3018431.1 adenylate/guanylate cyclase domain-containing protein [Pseudodonghicola flavimaris]
MVARNRFRRARLLTGAVVLLASLLIGLWHPGDRSSFWQGIEGRLLDARFLWRGPLPPPEGIAILAFDDATIAQQQAFPPTRAALAAAVSAATAAGARAVALDVLLLEPRTGDQALAAALAATPAVLAVAEAPAGTPLRRLKDGGFDLVIATAPRDPLPALAPTEQLSATARLGHAMPDQDTDGAVRRFDAARALATRDGPLWYPALAVAALAAADRANDLQLRRTAVGGRLTLGPRGVPLDLHGALPLLFYGPSGTIPTYSVARAAEVDLTGRIVFIGATATGFGDRHATPFDAAFPGVELHATLAANLGEDRLLRRDVPAWLWGVVLALAAAASGFVAAGLERPWLVALATSAVAATTAAALQLAFAAGWWLDATTALLCLLLGTGAGTVLRLLEHRRRAANLALYQSPRFVEQLASAADPGFDPGARPAVVLFVDVESFTSYSETLGPEATAGFLRLFHGLVEQAVDPLGGIIAHFAGDGAMVVFGLPDPGPEDAMNALRFIDALFAAVATCTDWPGLGLRVGGHAGPVQTGVLGGRHHRQLTVSGDVVNTASRLQDFAKTRGAAIALSAALLHSGPETRSWAARSGLSPAGQHRLRGRQTPLDIWTGPVPGSRQG